jgi:hypothetical protein
MANLTITAANVLAGSNATTGQGTAGAAITAGQALYVDTADNKYKLADANSATVAARSPSAIALNGAALNQPVSFLTAGDITIGAAVVPGTTYCLSATAGAICPQVDLTTGDYPVQLGIAKSASVIAVKFNEAGVAL